MKPTEKAARILEILKLRGWKLGVAESCTGGALAHVFTSVKGASASFVGAVVAYSNRVKVELLKVDPDVIRVHTVYSPQVAEQMAIGLRELLKVDVALSTTGEFNGKGYVYYHISTPNGGSSGKISVEGDRLNSKSIALDELLDELGKLLETV